MSQGMSQGGEHQEPDNMAEPPVQELPADIEQELQIGAADEVHGQNAGQMDTDVQQEGNANNGDQQNMEGKGENIDSVQADANLIQSANVEDREQVSLENSGTTDNTQNSSSSDNQTANDGNTQGGADNIIATVGGQLASTEDTDSKSAPRIIEMLVKPSSSTDTGGSVRISDLMTPGWSTNGESTTKTSEMFIIPRLHDAGGSVRISERILPPASTQFSDVIGVTGRTMAGSIPILGRPVSATASVMRPRTRHSAGVASRFAAERNGAAATALPPIEQSRLHLSLTSNKYNATFSSVDLHTIRSKTRFSSKDILIVGCSDGPLSDPFYFVKCNSTLCLELDRNKINRALSRNTTVPENFSIRRADVRDDVVEFKADILINNFVFNRYQTKEDIDKIANFCFRTLKPGKTCYILLRNSKSTTFWGDSLCKYGIRFTDREEMTPGFKTRVIKFTDLRETNCVHYCFNINFYITALEEAGFVNCQELPLRYEKPLAEPRSIWDDLKANPHQVILMAEKRPEAEIDTAQFEHDSD